MSHVLAHTSALIRCPSVTPAEAGALRYLADQLEGAGFSYHWLTFEEKGTLPVDNLYARLGDGAPHVLFAGHIDVVPPGDESAWTHPPFGAHVENGLLFGRGACDMKSGVAACLAAALRYLKEAGGRPRGSISFLITADEEGIAVNGTQKVVDWLKARGEHPDFCLLAECTGEERAADTVKIGRRGSLNAELVVRGLQGHAAYPHKAANPITGLIKVLSLLKAEPLDAGSAHFEASNLEITSIDTGNSTHNLIPASTRARFNIRFNDVHTQESLKDHIDRTVRAGLAGTNLSYSLAFEPGCDCFLTEPGPWVETLTSVVEVVTGRAPRFSTSGGTSDARFIKELCPVVELGVANTSAHKVDEYVKIADLELLTEVFFRFLKAVMEK